MLGLAWAWACWPAAPLASNDRAVTVQAGAAADYESLSTRPYQNEFEREEAQVQSAHGPAQHPCLSVRCAPPPAEHPDILATRTVDQAFLTRWKHGACVWARS